MFAALVAGGLSLHYLTCRHTYESNLLAELKRSSIAGTSPCTAVTRVEAAETLPDPAYALQILPYAREVRGSSIKVLAEDAADGLDVDLLGAAPRGAIVTHVLTPDLLRGVPPAKAKLFRRCEAIADQLSQNLRGRFAAARPRREVDSICATPLLLQLLLLEPELLVVSLAPSLPHRSGIGYWPVRLAGGFADCSLDGDMPSSAYRKVIESFEAMHLKPQPGERCIDLGACPGGWTAAMRRCNAIVTAVDRSPLDAALMRDPKVAFVQGDAFTFEPPVGGADWMVSDVAAYPGRCVELIDRWCERRWARRMVVTMKFTGTQPDFDAIDEAKRAADAHSFRFRAMHHFSNKNEVTLMMDGPYLT